MTSIERSSPTQCAHVPAKVNANWTSSHPTINNQEPAASMASSPRANPQHHRRPSSSRFSALLSSSVSSNASPGRPSSSHSTLTSHGSAVLTGRRGWTTNAEHGGRKMVGGKELAEEGVRQSNLTVFEWKVSKLQALDDQLRQAVELDPVEFDVLRDTPVIGGGAFKIDVQVELDQVSTTAARSDASTSTTEIDDKDAAKRGLVLYLSSLTMDYGTGRDQGPTSIMVGLKQVEPAVGNSLGATKFIWSKWEDDFWFTPDAEFWRMSSSLFRQFERCELPALEDLLQHPEVEENDALTLVVQVHTPPELIPELQHMSYMPRNLLLGLEISLDNASTGDVKFICRERERPPVPDLSFSLHSRESSASFAETVMSSTSVLAGIRSRKRILWAHSDILKARSEYFETMLGSSWAEGEGAKEGERHVHVVNLEDTDFGVLYWLLKYLYTNSLEFDTEDDVRVVYQLANVSNGGPPPPTGVLEWEWQPVVRPMTESVGGGDGESTRTVGSSTTQASVSLAGTGGKRPVIPSSGGTPRTPGSRSLSAAPRSKFGTPASSNAAQRSSSSAHGQSSSKSRPSSIPILSPNRSPSLNTTTLHQPTSPSSYGHARLSLSVVDPHAHPTTPPPAASALSVYHIASRYQLPELEGLCVDHILKTLRADTAMQYLLASSAYDELNSVIQDFVVEYWPEISQTTQFEVSNAEVAVGVWGEKGGRVLTSLFRRLHSPNALRYAAE